MRIGSVIEFVVKMGLPTHSTVLTRINHLMVTATDLISTHLDSDLREAARSDVFSIPEHGYRLIGPDLVLKLTQGFIDSATPPTLTIFSNYPSYRAGDEGTVIDPVKYHVDYNKGLIHVYSMDLRGRTVVASYTAGFTISNDANFVGTEYVNAVVPEDLTTAVYLLTESLWVEAETGKEQVGSVRKGIVTLISKFDRRHTKAIASTSTSTGP